jgi:hypothetical protein
MTRLIPQRSADASIAPAGRLTPSATGGRYRPSTPNDTQASFEENEGSSQMHSAVLGAQFEDLGSMSASRFLFSGDQGSSLS